MFVFRERTNRRPYKWEIKWDSVETKACLRKVTPQTGQRSTLSSRNDLDVIKEVLIGGFYEHQLQCVMPPDIFPIWIVIKKIKGKTWVRCRGWPDKSFWSVISTPRYYFISSFVKLNKSSKSKQHDYHTYAHSRVINGNIKRTAIIHARLRNALSSSIKNGKLLN